MGLLSILNLAKSSLFFNQAAIQTIGHNIANAGVEGYSRQEVVASPSRPTQEAFGFVGNGISVDNVRRFTDNFLNLQITRIKAELASLNAQGEGIRLIESFLNERSADTGLSSALNNFFSAAEDLTTRPQGGAERTAFINAGLQLAQEFNQLTTSIEEVRIRSNQDIGRAVNAVNERAARIAELNKEIQRVEGAGSKDANDLRDERQRLVEEIAELIDVRVTNETDGSVTVLVAGGFPLVSQTLAGKMVGIANVDNIVGTTPPVALLKVGFENTSGAVIDVTPRITGGEIGGLLNFRDNTLGKLIDNMDAIAATVIREVNAIHQQGYGLDGSTNLDFYNPLKLTATTPSTNSRDTTTNSSNLTVNATDSRILDQTVLTLANYQIVFTSATSFDIVDTDTGVKIDATKVSINGASLGTDSTVTSYTFSGNRTTIEFEGIRVVAESLAGTPQVGDVVNISTRKGAATGVDVTQLLKGDIRKLATSNDPNIPGDNSVALQFAGLKTQIVAQRGSTSIPEFFNSIISTFGTESRNIFGRETLLEGVSDSLQETRFSATGVSIDEELVNLIRFQQNFGASARLITLTAELMDQIANLIN